MAIKIEECTGFITDVEKARADWLEQAKSSWNELKKLNEAGKMYSLRSNQSRRRIHYPLWYSTFRIRKPLIYGRTPVIIGKDTAYGDDPIGRTAAILIERLGKGIIQSFSFDDTMSAIRDDMLATDAALGGRAYYEATFRKEKIKEYFQQVETQDGGQVIVDQQGNQVTDISSLMQDEQGIYRMSEQEQDVEYERVYFKHTLNSDVYIDPYATKWEDVQAMAWATDYSERDFKKTYGEEALRTIPETGLKYTEGKRKVIRVYEYWDYTDRDIVWFAEGGVDFLPKPNSHELSEIPEGEDRNRQDDIYGLEDFFPCPEPLVFNAPTDNFYPVTEYYQLSDLIREIHDIASKMFIITKAIRPRLVYDSSIEGIQKLINEASIADAIGITNLSQSLVTAGGNLANAMQYMPIEPMVQSLLNYIQIFQTKLDQFAQLSGTSDLLQGKTDNVERTYGEQQMKAKYALNQIEPMQRGFQNYCKETIELLCEMAIKNFSDETLIEYIVPKTLDREDQERYEQAIKMLKEDKKRRFRIDIETDSTIALNEEFDKAARLEVTNAVTKIIDYSSQVMERPNGLMLVPTLLKSASYLVQGYRQGKQFVDDIHNSIKTISDKMEEAQANPPETPPPPPDPKMLALQWEQQKFQMEAPAKQMQMQMDHEFRMAQLQTTQQRNLDDANAKQQDVQAKLTIAQIEYGSEQGKTQGEQALWAQENQILVERNQIAKESAMLKAQNDAKTAELKDKVITTNTMLEGLKLNLQGQAQKHDEIRTLIENKHAHLDRNHEALKTGLSALSDSQAKIGVSGGLDRVTAPVRVGVIKHDASGNPMGIVIRNGTSED